MHILYSTAIGTEIIDEVHHEIHGIVSDLLIDPDNGKLIAAIASISNTDDPYAVQMNDVVSWGQRLHIGSPNALGPLDDFVRLQEVLSDRRTFIRQRIVSESGNYFGKCVDVQFNGQSFMIEWIFPRKYFRKGIALPASDIIEVTDKAIRIKNQLPKEERILSDELLPEKSLRTTQTPATGTLHHHG
jgi:hypothetical protein